MRVIEDNLDDMTFRAEIDEDRRNVRGTNVARITISTIVDGERQSIGVYDPIAGTVSGNDRSPYVGDRKSVKACAKLADEIADES